VHISSQAQSTTIALTKNIAVSNDVYELLTKLKLPGESFSDVIRRQFKQGARLSDIRGSRTISKQDWVKVRKTIRDSELITQKKLDKMYASNYHSPIDSQSNRKP